MGGVEAWENESFIISYRDPAFPACPECGSPNVRLLRRNSYWCLDCKSRDTCVVEGSTGIERRRALIRLWAILLVTLGIMAVYLALVLLGHAG